MQFHTSRHNLHIITSRHNLHIITSRHKATTSTQSTSSIKSTITIISLPCRKMLGILPYKIGARLWRGFGDLVSKDRKGSGFWGMLQGQGTREQGNKGTREQGNRGYIENNKADHVFTVIGFFVTSDYLILIAFAFGNVLLISLIKDSI